MNASRSRRPDAGLGDRAPENLPTALTSFVGREHELGEVRALLSSRRLLTLTGTGGCGKSRLALRTAMEAAGEHPGGVWWVELALISDPALVVPTLAQVVGVRAAPGEAELDAVATQLADHRALVVLDNCEHVLEETARAAESLARRCPHLRVIATSREPLRAEGETEWRVPPLGLPAHGQLEWKLLEASDAMQLFAARAALVRPDFELTTENATAVATICRQLDGMPLAIELAAARLRMLSVDQIAAALADRFRLLAGGVRTAVARHQALRASVDWSHDLLSDRERMLFRRLGVFTGSFTLDGAEKICAGDGLEHGEVFDLLAALVDKSLVQVVGHGAVARYRLLETMRQYAQERLERAAEDGAVRDRHRDFYLEVAERVGPGLLTARQGDVLDLLDAESADLGSALSWAAATEPEKALRLSVALTFWWRLRSLFAQAEAGYAQALAATTEPSVLRARAQWGQALLLTFAGALDPALSAARQALQAAERVGDDSTTARALWLIGIITMWPDPIGSRPGLERARGLAVTSRDDLALLHTTQALGMTYVFQDENRRARPFLVEAHQLAERMGQQDGLAWHWVAIANGAWVRGDLPSLRSAADRGLAVASAAGDVVTESVTTSLLAVADTETGHPKRGLARLAAARARAVTGGGLLMLPVTEWVAAQALAADGQLEEARRALDALINDGAGGLAYILARAHMTLAEALRLLGDAHSATRAAERCLDLAGQIAARTIAAEAQLTLGRVAAARSDWLEAQRLHHEALPVSVDYGSPRLPRVLDGLAALACGLERHTEAARIIGAAGRVWDETGTTPWPHQRSEQKTVEERVRNALGDQDFVGALAAGRALDAEGVVAYVQRTRGSRKRPSTGWDSLTPTERQVVALVGAGASNQEIAAELLMSVATVKSHLTHVYSKLALRSRTALAGEVVRRGEAAQS